MTDDPETIRWLEDRALIGELLHAFARALDGRDWTGYADLFTEEGALVLPWRGRTPKAQLAQAAAQGVGRFRITHHVSSNHQIELAGDTAVSRSYVQAMHAQSDVAGPDDWLLLGWYDCSYRRTDAGWKFVEVVLRPVWQSRALA